MSMGWLPNALTIARCVFAGLVFWGLFQADRLGAVQEATSEDAAILEQLWFQFALLGFIAGALTDFLDGWAARQFNAHSRFGVWLDPIADKLLVGAALLGLAMVLESWLIAIPAAAIIGRDVFMTWFRATPRGKAVVAPSQLAKWKTGFEMAAIIALLLPLALFQSGGAGAAAPAWSTAFIYLLLIGPLWIAAALSLWTAGQYIKLSGQGGPRD